MAGLLGVATNTKVLLEIDLKKRDRSKFNRYRHGQQIPKLGRSAISCRLGRLSRKIEHWFQGICKEPHEPNGVVATM